MYTKILPKDKIQNAWHSIKNDQAYKAAENWEKSQSIQSI